MTDLPQNSTDWPPRNVVCVGAVVLQGERVLFVRQAQGHTLEGQWSIPWGIVDPGESPDAAALRETREESGVADGWLPVPRSCLVGCACRTRDSTCKGGHL
jgi:ADP-ribose pyrophosphatase YjhB (NUDIX family)